MLAASVARANSLLMLHAERPLRPGTVARLAQESSRTASVSALNTLVRMGIAKRVTQLGHPAFEPASDSRYFAPAYLTALADMPIDECLDEARIVAVVVHGSMARPGSKKPGSDIDIMVVGRVPNERATRAAFDHLGERYGRQIDLTIVSADELRTALADQDAYLTNASRGAVIRGTLDGIVD